MYHIKPSSPALHWQSGLRCLASAFFVVAGLNHFWNPRFYRNIVPPMFPAPGVLVLISGMCEIVGGLGLQVSRLRRIAGWGLVALLVAVFPANIYMAIAPQRIPHLHLPLWLLWARLPMQGVVIAWVWFAALHGTRARGRHDRR